MLAALAVHLHDRPVLRRYFYRFALSSGVDVPPIPTATAQCPMRAQGEIYHGESHPNPR